MAVAGAGTMGAGIAHVCALAGACVNLMDVTEEAAASGKDAVSRNLDRMLAKAKITPEERSAALGRIVPSGGLGAAKDAELVVEAVPESPRLKFETFEALDETAPPEAILASNTSSISITAIAARTRRPGAVIGLHFMNPAPAMKLVEVIRGLATRDETARTACEFARALGKTPVEVRDFPGFVSNRVLAPMINEAVFALMEGVAPAESIDDVMTLGMNHPMGPLALADLIGLDTCLAILEVLHREIGDDRYRPCPLLRQYVAAGWLGRKSGRGFHVYGRSD